MHEPICEQVERVIKWGKRLLYFLLFLPLVLVMGYWHTIITYTFLGSMVLFVGSAIMFFEAEEREREVAETIPISAILFDMYIENQ